MTLFENEEDHSNESQVMVDIMHHLNEFPFVGMGLDGESYFEPTGTETGISHDFDISHHGRPVGVIEIKCRTGQYTRDYLNRFGSRITKERLTKLRYHHRHGKHVMLAVRSSDGIVAFVMLKTLLLHHHRLITTEGEGTTNHGKTKNGKDVIDIPYDLFTEIGERDG